MFNCSLWWRTGNTLNRAKHVDIWTKELFSGDPNFSNILVVRFEELKRSCERGFVIPFVGAGMSKSAGCPEWKEYLLNLCVDANLDRDAMRARLEVNGDYEGVMNDLVVALGEKRFNLAMSEI